MHSLTIYDLEQEWTLKGQEALVYGNEHLGDRTIIRVSGGNSNQLSEPWMQSANVLLTYKGNVEVDGEVITLKYFGDEVAAFDAKITVTK